MKIPENVIEQVRSQVDIVDVVSQYVQLKQSGKNLFGLCPFHEERTPSFSVNEEKQIFYCFSCGRGGNVFKFLMEIENLSFPEAVKKAAEMAHLDVDDKYFADAGPVNRETSEQKQLVDLHEQAVKLYHHILVNTKMGRPALDYLRKRGVNDDTIETYQLGYAPQTRLLKPFFDQRQIDYQLLRKSGLFSEDQEGHLRDRFIDRVMYPIRNASGQPVAFSGRLVTKNVDLPKYLNSPETELFNKRKILFNLDLARPNIRSKQPALLFEGFMDVISAYQSGIKNGIASMGTSLTEQQIYDIQRITREVIICYDGDAPGQKAIRRAIDAFNQTNHQLNLKVVSIPDGMDPDEFIRHRGADQFKALLEHAQSPIEFELTFLKNQANLKSEAGQAAYISDALKLISSVPSEISRNLYLNHLAEEFEIDKQVLKKQLVPLVRKVVTKRPAKARQPQLPSPTSPSLQKRDKVTVAQMQLLNRMLHNRDVWLKVKGISGFSFVDEQYQMLYLLAEAYFNDYDDYNVATFSNMITEDSLQSLLIEVDEMDLPKEPSPVEIDNDLDIIMKKAPVETKIKKKKSELKQAAKIGDVDKQRQLMVELLKLEQQKRTKEQV
ncbi:DNA primase [Lentilactobacillus raoultii]|uniref:DNA primase n=1 Tax=Lentilactobacillus raoultii TaxID=1987503 RepID=A0ABW3PKQ2_9LACO|nr:DNA primase [Lentilactobacillus raoultii]